jgi:hypothetical protein
VALDPYRQASATTPTADEPAAFDVEECIVHGLGLLVGGLGLLAGVLFARPTELTLGGLLIVFVLRVVYRERARLRLHHSLSRMGLPLAAAALLALSAWLWGTSLSEPRSNVAAPAASHEGPSFESRRMSPFERGWLRSR